MSGLSVIDRYMLELRWSCLCLGRPVSIDTRREATLKLPVSWLFGIDRYMSETTIKLLVSGIH
jgi:hypothetical protein